MTTPSLTPTPLSQGDTLLIALFIAALVHVAILLGINFSAPQAAKANRSIDVTVSHLPAQKAPKRAKLLATENQHGEEGHLPKAESSTLPPVPAMPQTVPVASKKNQPEAVVAPKPAAPKLLTQPKAPQKVVTTPEPAAEPQASAVVVEERPALSAEALQQQIAQLGERIRNNQQSPLDTKIKFVNSVSSHKFLAAQYVKDWEDKVERTGNLNYPEAARKQGLSQTLTMDVGIKADGSIHSMRIVKSSGNAELDEAAKRIVKMSAPFAELPSDLLNEVNVLVITRVWKFSDETGMTAR